MIVLPSISVDHFMNALIEIKVSILVLDELSVLEY